MFYRSMGITAVAVGAWTSTVGAQYATVRRFGSTTKRRSDSMHDGGYLRVTLTRLR